jgi:hypothetical protein
MNSNHKELKLKKSLLRYIAIFFLIFVTVNGKAADP